MGLIKEGDDYIVLTDIAGVEDHLGDMDFKVAGTSEGITALQMDIKITGVTFEILRDALEQARQGRLFILGKMAEAIDAPREQMSEYAPRIETIKIDPEKIGAVIGKGGETIRGMQEEFEAEIDIDDDGSMRVYAPTGAQVEACIARIESMTREAEVGDQFKGKVVKTTTFGAFVELVKGTDGLLHISNVKPGERVGAVEDVLNSGRRDRGHRGRGRPRARPDRPAALRRSLDRRQVGRGAHQGVAPATRRWAAAAAATAAVAAVAASASASTAAAAADAVVTVSAADADAIDARPLAGLAKTPSQRRRSRQPTGVELPEEVLLTELPSGVRVVTEAVPSMRSVALGLWVRTGSRDEGPGQEGLSHFLEHLLFKGTERYSAIEISELFDGMGAAANAATSKESTHIHARFLDEHLDGRLRPDGRDDARPDVPATSTPSARWCWRRSRCTRTSPLTACTTFSPRRCTATIRSAAASWARPRSSPRSRSPRSPSTTAAGTWRTTS